MNQPPVQNSYAFDYLTEANELARKRVIAWNVFEAHEKFLRDERRPTVSIVRIRVSPVSDPTIPEPEATNGKAPDLRKKRSKRNRG